MSIEKHMELSETEKLVLKNIHLTGSVGKACGSLPYGKRLSMLQGLIEKGYLNKNGLTLTKLGIEESSK